MSAPDQVVITFIKHPEISGAGEQRAHVSTIVEPPVDATAIYVATRADLVPQVAQRAIMEREAGPMTATRILALEHAARGRLLDPGTASVPLLAAGLDSIAARLEGQERAIVLEASRRLVDLAQKQAVAETERVEAAQIPVAFAPMDTAPRDGRLLLVKTTTPPGFVLVKWDGPSWWEPRAQHRWHLHQGVNPPCFQGWRMP